MNLTKVGRILHFIGAALMSITGTLIAVGIVTPLTMVLFGIGVAMHFGGAYIAGEKYARPVIGAFGSLFHFVPIALKLLKNGKTREELLRRNKELVEKFVEKYRIVSKYSDSLPELELGEGVGEVGGEVSELVLDNINTTFTTVKDDANRIVDTLRRLCCENAMMKRTIGELCTLAKKIVESATDLIPSMQAVM